MFQQKKPYSAVTVSIDTLTSETYDEEDLSGIPDLVEVISLQSSGPSEAARAIRKKLKYGNTHRQIRALVLLDGLIQNAGPRFQRAFADEPLLERLRVCGTSDLSDPVVKKKCRELFHGWAQYGSQPGLERIAWLHTELPKRKTVVKQETSKVIKETENPFGDEDDEEGDGSSTSRGPSLTDSLRSQHQHQRSSSSTSIFSISSSSSTKKKGSISISTSASGSKSKGGKRKPFDMEAEREQMKATIAEALVATTNLLNAVQSINREKERISQNAVALARFEECKNLRRRVLRYIHHVSQEQWLGPLLHANDELVHALMTFEQLDQSVDADSDSDDELAEQAHLYRMVAAKGKEDMTAGKTSPPAPPELADLSGLSLTSSPPPPPRPPSGSSPSSTRQGRGPPPPRPAKASMLSSPPSRPRQEEVSKSPADDDDDDDDDPFADSNVVDQE